VADERTNSIIMVASEDYTNRIRSLIETLDQETPKGKEKIHVYYLEYAVAEEIVAVLKDLPKEETPKNRRRQGSAGGFRQGDDYGRQGHQQPDYHRRSRRLRNARGNHQPDRHPARHGLHRSIDHGSQC
jgi:type II secretory pathway component GspD/PulD (secretin)